MDSHLISCERDETGRAVLTRFMAGDLAVMVLNAELSAGLDPRRHDLAAIWRCCELVPTLAARRETIHLH